MPRIYYSSAGGGGAMSDNTHKAPPTANTSVMGPEGIAGNTGDARAHTTSTTSNGMRFFLTDVGIILLFY